MEEQQFASNGRRSPESRQLTKPALLLITVVAAIAGIETSRRAGIVVPTPFMIIYGTMAIAAASCGLRVGLIAASFTTAYAVFSYTVNFGPVAMTGSPSRVVAAALLGFLVAGSLGYGHDARNALLRKLRLREQELSAARERLQKSVDLTTAHLDSTRTKLGQARYQMEQAMSRAPVGVIAIDENRQLSFINEAALQQFGCDALPDSIKDWDTLVRAVHILDTNGKRLLPPDGPVSKALRYGESFKNFECRIIGFDGESRWCAGYIGPVQDARQRVIGASIMFHETTVQRDTALALQRLTQMLFKVQEDERGSLARALHEHIGQSLTAIKFGLHAASKDEDPRPALASSMSQIDQLTDAVRKLSLDLRPTALDDFGLQTALDSHLRQLPKPEGLECRLTVDDELADISGETATVAYRIVQEAVDNSITHAGATSIEVRLSRNDNMLRVEIIDDGCGFEVSALDRHILRSRHMGLLFMRERARQSGGQLSISSHPGNGTWVSTDLPLKTGASNA